jgi:hypothetical protein
MSILPSAGIRKIGSPSIDFVAGHGKWCSSVIIFVTPFPFYGF